VFTSSSHIYQEQKPKSQSIFCCVSERDTWHYGKCTRHYTRVKGCNGLDHTTINVNLKQMEKQAAENKKRRTQTKLDNPLR